MHPLHASQSRAAHSYYRASSSAAFLHLALPIRESLITSLEYWTQEAAAYRIWRHQISVSPTWFKPPVTDEQGNEVNGVKALIMEAKREQKEAKKIAEVFDSVLPAREVLIDNEKYWDIEAEAWKFWRERVEKEWVKEGEKKAEMYMAER